MVFSLITTLTALLISHLAFSTPLPPPTGQYPVSFTQHVFNHTTLNDILAPNGTTTDFLVTFYYPSLDRSTVPYLDPPNPDLPAQLILATILSDYYGYDHGALASLTADLTFQGLTLKTPSQVAGGWPYPTLIFLPEFGLPSVVYTTLLTDLASQGYIVAAIDHPYEAPMLRYPYGGPLVQGLPLNLSQTGAESAPTVDRALAIRVEDTKAFLDFYPALVQSFRAPFNFTAYAIIGHGLGGTAAINILCDPAVTRNPSFKILGAVDLDGGAQDESSTVLALFVHGDYSAGPKFTWGSGSGRDVVIEGAMHNDFSDLAALKVFSEKWRSSREDPIEKVGGVSAEEMVRLVRSKVSYFLGQVVNGTFGS